MRLSSFHRSVGKCGLAAAALLVFAGVAQAQQKGPAPTFTKDVAPIFQEKCESCHRPDSIAPMSLRTYEEARPWAKSIRTRVASRQMPPWHIDKGVGIQQFKYDRSLSDAQIDTIVRWIDAGAPRGDSKDMPPAKDWGDGVIDIARIRGWVEKAGFEGYAEAEICSRENWWKREGGEVLDTCIARHRSAV